MTAQDTTLDRRRSRSKGPPPEPRASHRAFRACWLAAIVLATISLVPATAIAGDAATGTALPNLIGAGIGPTPDYPGADSRSIAVAPLFRYQFKGSQRSVYLAGPLANFNLVNDPAWHAGPLLNYRPGREDADDAVVRQLHEIADTVEAGAFISYRWYGKGAVPWEVQVSANVLQGFTSTDGTRGWVGASILTPISRRIVVGLGGTINYTDAKTMDGYYGIAPADSVKSGLPVYLPGGGLSSSDLWLTVAFLVHSNWAVGAAVYAQHLRGNAADSPWVRTHGNTNQVSFGIGAAYYWQ